MAQLRFFVELPLPEGITAPEDANDVTMESLVLLEKIVESHYKAPGKRFQVDLIEQISQRSGSFTAIVTGHYVGARPPRQLA